MFRVSSMASGTGHWPSPGGRVVSDRKALFAFILEPPVPWLESVAKCLGHRPGLVALQMGEARLRGGVAFARFQEHGVVADRLV
jgi:hypothetical protein